MPKKLKYRLSNLERLFDKVCKANDLYAKAGLAPASAIIASTISAPMIPVPSAQTEAIIHAISILKFSQTPRSLADALSIPIPKAVSIVDEDALGIGAAIRELEKALPPKPL